MCEKLYSWGISHHIRLLSPWLTNRVSEKLKHQTCYHRTSCDGARCPTTGPAPFFTTMRGTLSFFLSHTLSLFSLSLSLSLSLSFSLFLSLSLNFHLYFFSLLSSFLYIMKILLYYCYLIRWLVPCCIQIKWFPISPRHLITSELMFSCDGWELKVNEGYTALPKSKIQ